MIFAIVILLLLFHSYRFPISPVTPVRNPSRGRMGSTKRESFRESFRKKRRESQDAGDGRSAAAVRKKSIVQITINQQNPKLDTNQQLNYFEMPNSWAEVTDCQNE